MIVSAGYSYHRPVPFVVTTKYSHDAMPEPLSDRWTIGDNEDGTPGDSGLCHITVLEVIDSAVLGGAVVFVRDFIDPEGLVVSATRKRVMSLRGFKGMLSRRRFTRVPSE